MFTSAKRALPGLTVAMLAISGFILRSWGWLLLLGVVAGGIARAAYARRNEAFRERFDAAWLTLPLIGRPSRGWQRSALRRHAGDAGRRRRAILKALQAAAETLSTARHARRRDGRLVQVREGALLASALATKRFPGCWRCSRLGEQTGQLPVMLERAARSAPRCSAAPCRWHHPQSRC